MYISYIFIIKYELKFLFLSVRATSHKRIFSNYELNRYGWFISSVFFGFSPFNYKTCNLILLFGHSFRNLLILARLYVNLFPAYPKFRYFRSKHFEENYLSQTSSLQTYRLTLNVANIFLLFFFF